MNKKELKRLCRELKVKETGMYTKGYNIGINAVLSALLSQGNPPLKFEELEIGMWVWSTYADRYIYIRELREQGYIYRGKTIIEDSELGDMEWAYDDGTFHRYEVEENEDD